MEKITGYDVILTFSPIDEITGHVFEVFDYYLFLKDYFRVGMIFLGNMTPEKLKIAFNSKYNYNFDDIKNDLMYYSKEEIKTKNTFCFDVDTFVLLTDGNIHALQTYGIKLLTKKLYGFLCFSDEMLIKNIDCTLYNHITYLQDFRIYGKNRRFKSLHYVKKLPFCYYKEYKRDYDNTGMMYITFNCRKISPYVVSDYHLRSGCAQTMVVVPYKLPEYDAIDRNIFQVEAPVEDFFSKFDTYIYTPVKRQFDCSPRLVTECFFHKKKIFMDLPYVDEGLQTRYKDCIENINQLDLGKNDALLNIILESKKG